MLRLPVRQRPPVPVLPGTGANPLARALTVVTVLLVMVLVGTTAANAAPRPAAVPQVRPAVVAAQPAVMPTASWCFHRSRLLDACVRSGVASWYVDERFTWSGTWRLVNQGSRTRAPEWLLDLCSLVPVPGAGALCRRMFEAQGKLIHSYARNAVNRRTCLRIAFNSYGGRPSYSSVTCAR